MLQRFIEWCTPKMGDVDLIPLALAVAGFTMLAAIVEIVRHRRGRTPQDTPIARTLKNFIASEPQPSLPWTWKDYTKLAALGVVAFLVGVYR